MQGPVYVIIIYNFVFIDIFMNTINTVLTSFKIFNRCCGYLIGSLSTRVFETRMATGSAIFTFNVPSHNHIHVAKNLFSIRDE